ncbi:hypothetical protein CEXT_626131 [Caerostris extrusa]|uniref:Uncharacterized protein n=1 Tax=Caerostris extrusa TaxID=172846 RepID=A0AAV4XDQ6_CAEEX|nr:hypothetical protein CEXT_626131 [Caerostris extrusa]
MRNESIQNRLKSQDRMENNGINKFLKSFCRGDNNAKHAAQPPMSKKVKAGSRRGDTLSLSKGRRNRSLRGFLNNTCAIVLDRKLNDSRMGCFKNNLVHS